MRLSRTKKSRLRVFGGMRIKCGIIAVLFWVSAPAYGCAWICNDAGNDEKRPLRQKIMHADDDVHMFFAIIATQTIAKPLKDFLKMRPDFDVNIKNEYGEGALHILARRGACALIRTLKEKKASLDIRNERNQTPHDVARLHLQFAAQRLLMR
jgi:hypothetical protein